MKKTAVALGVVIMALAACAAPSSSVGLSTASAQQFVGRTAAEVEAALGPPVSRSASALVYDTRRTGPQTAQSMARTSLGGGGTVTGLSVGRVTYTCRWTFRLGADGRVSGWGNEGALCASLG